jgi:Chitobiase/beta-hexosaminidase C-terminal domain
MKKFLIHATAVFFAVIVALFSASVSAQTLSLNDGSILQSNTNRVGVNIGAIDYWDNGQILKNLIGSSNPGMEPLLNQQIWALGTAGTATTFTIPDIYDGVPPNYWSGATFTVVEAQSGGAELGCTGTVASNTGPNYPVTGVTTWVAPVITVSAPCGAPFAAGDIITIKKSNFPTPESWWESGGLGGTAGTVSGGAQLLSDTADLCATCGTQALTMNATASGSRATAAWYFDSEFADNIFVLMNGTYQLSFWAKAVSGTPVMTISALRGSAGGFNCGTYTPKLTTSWAQYTWTCTASESAAATTPTSAQVIFNTSGGSAYLDNVSFEKTSSNASNTTVLRDEVIEALQNYYGTSIGNNPGTFRYWVNQNGETISNWTQPDYAHAPTSGGTGYFVGPGGSGSVSLSLEDYLAICKYLNAAPYLEIPVTLTTSDAANLVEFLASPSTTTYGARRAALGQTAPWTSEFSTIHLSFCNECWNGQSFAGQSLPERTSAPNEEYYYDYSVRARDIFAAMRADSYYSTSLDLVMNAQTAVNYTADTAIARAHPDSIEIEDYTYGSVSSFSTDAALWQPAMVDPWEKVTNPADIRNFYQSVHDYQSNKTCGGSGTATCKVNIYEWGQGTVNGGIDQTHLDYINAGAGEGVVMALQPLLNLQYYDILPQSFFSLTEYKNSAASGMNSKLWGNVIDMGGATNNVRPEFLGVSLVNQSIIGPMYACPINSNLTYNFPGSPNGEGAMPAMNNVPYLYAFCFENGTKRSLVLINTDLSNSHTINFSGTNPPFGTVTVRQYAPSDLDEMNEAPTGTATNRTAATSAIETSSLSSPTSISLPPFSATALDYTAQGLAAAAMPTFSPAAGTYTTAQSVAINDTTSGVTIYYTTDGTTPTASSNVYGGPISVTAAETLQAIAVASGYANSPTGTAAYAIDPLLPTPAFSVAAGTYATAQSVTISDAMAGTTIYYTTNGTAPTSSSNVYSGAITVGATETLEAIAVKTGYTNSSVAAAPYVLAPALPMVTFSPAAGTFTSALSVSMNEATSGAVIYYTTNGTTPTTSSTQYGGPLWLTATETLTAIAVEKGYTNSPAATATFTIAPVLPTPTLSLATGIYTSTQTLTIADSVAGTAIYYTTNGATPTTSSTKYTGPITVSASETVEAIAVETGYSNSLVASAVLTVNSTLAPPAFSPSGGIYVSTQSIIISDTNPGTTIYYTTNGTTPTTSSSVYTGPITVSSSETIEALAVQAGHVNSQVSTSAYTINSGTSTLPTPTISPAGGTYTTAQSVTISDTTSGTTIYYTTNGTTPTTSSTKYTGPITVSVSETLEAIAVETGHSNSAVAVASFSIGTVLPAPTFSLAAGTYASPQSVTISDGTAGTTIYYTTNGATPTTSSTKYTGAITVSASETLEAIAVKTGYTNSAVATSVYTISAVIPAPTFSPVGGTYATTQTVTIADATAGTTIYYTTDGTTPTTSSTVYSGPITVSSSETLEAIAVGTAGSAAAKAATSGTNSAVAMAAYTISSTATALPGVTFSPAGGTYTSAMSVAMSEATSGTVIYYTTNGTTPTTASTQYGGPLWLTATETLNAIAVKKGGANSPVTTATFTIAPVLPTPTFSLGTGIYTSTQSVTIADATGGTTIYYTTNGTTPTTASIKYTGPIAVAASETLQAIAVETGYTNSLAGSVTYTINSTLALPTFSPGPGIYIATQSVTIGENNPGTTIYYTTDGTTPTTSSTKYTGPITVSSSETLEVFAVETGHVNSPVATASYTINSANSALPAPVFSVPAGTYTASQSVAVSDATSGATIYYTINGATPSTSSTKYTGPITVSSSETLEAIAVETGHTNSPVAAAAYTINSAAAATALPAPTLSLAAGTYAAAQPLTIGDAVAGASIYYTTNGTTPTASSTKYTGTITVSATETLKAIAIETGHTNSPVSTAVYTISSTASALPAVTFSPASGTYTSAMSVTMSEANSGAVIYYTTDGTTPTISSTQYGGALWLTASETLKAIAVAKGSANSPTSTATFTIAHVLPTPTFSLAAGIYKSTQSVTISDATAGTTIYYTTNGTTPTPSSAKYTGAITVAASETLAAIAVETGYTNSLPGTVAYTINSTLALPSVSPGGGIYVSPQSVTIGELNAGATIYYTTNGATPTTSSTRYTGPITVSASETLKILAVETGHINSPVATASYTIQ